MVTKQLIFTEQQIQQRIKELGSEITADYQEKNLLVIGILNGAFIFMADLVRTIDLPLEVDFIRVKSYGDGTESSGKVTFTKDIELDIAGKDVLIVEDIVDTGKTMRCLKEHILKRNPASLKVCALINKEERRDVTVHLDYSGFDISEGFLVGYGLDYAQHHRHYPNIYHLILNEN